MSGCMVLSCYLVLNPDSFLDYWIVIYRTLREQIPRKLQIAQTEINLFYHTQDWRLAAFQGMETDKALCICENYHEKCS